MPKGRESNYHGTPYFSRAPMSRKIICNYLFATVNCTQVLWSTGGFALTVQAPAHVELGISYLALSRASRPYAFFFAPLLVPMRLSRACGPRIRTALCSRVYLNLTVTHLGWTMIQHMICFSSGRGKTPGLVSLIFRVKF